MELSEEARRSGHAKAAFNLGNLYRPWSSTRKRAAADTQRLPPISAASMSRRATSQRPFSSTRRRAAAERQRLPSVSATSTGRRAMELYEEARRAGDTKAASNLGGLCDQKSDLPMAMELYEEARRGRDTKAAMNLGLLYARGPWSSTRAGLQPRAGLQLAVPSSGNLCS